MKNLVVSNVRVVETNNAADKVCLTFETPSPSGKEHLKMEIVAPLGTGVEYVRSILDIDASMIERVKS